MTKSDMKRVISAHKAGVSTEVCVGMILDINWKRNVSDNLRKCEPVSYLGFKSECQKDVPTFYNLI